MARPRKPGIYRITNTVNGKIYIGQSRNIWKRLEAHRTDLRTGTAKNQHLQNAWNKYGESAFVFETIEDVPLPTHLTDKKRASMLNSREQYHIDSSGCLNRDIGYNLQSKATGGKEIMCSKRVQVRICEAYIQGFSMHKVALKEGVHGVTVKKVLLRHGVEIRKRRYSKSRLAMIADKRTVVDSYRKGVPIIKIAEEYNCAPNAVRKLLIDADVHEHRRTRKERAKRLAPTMVMMRLQGINIDDIAVYLNVSTHQVDCHTRFKMQYFRQP